MNKFSKILGIISFWLCWPALFIRLRGSIRCRVIVTDGRNILLVQNWLGPGGYSLPGGGLKKNEDPPEAVIRELKEETGIVASKDQLKLIHSQFIVKEMGLAFSCLGYCLRIDKGKKLTRQKFEIADLEWISFDEILDKYKINPTARYLIATWLADNHLLD
jgi:8-oxo-dGTP pyrophosphatase MutT (NUDIX family)